MMEWTVDNHAALLERIRDPDGDVTPTERAAAIRIAELEIGRQGLTNLLHSVADRVEKIAFDLPPGQLTGDLVMIAQEIRTAAPRREQ